MIYRSRWRTIWAGLMTSALLFCAPGSFASDKLIWLLRDLPPLTVLSGSTKGQGTIDQLMPYLMASMPNYQHTVVNVNRARAIQMLKSSSLACDPTLVWNPSRAHSIIYSNPVMRLHSNGLIIRHHDQSLIEPYLHNGSVNLTALLKAQTLKLGVIAQRSYGEWIDTQLSQSPVNQLSTHYGNNAFASLLQMQQAGRVQAVLGYWPEAWAMARQQGLAPATLNFYPIEGAPTYQTIYIGCTNTPEGQQAILSINKALEAIPDDVFIKFQDQWPEPEQPENSASLR